MVILPVVAEQPLAVVSFLVVDSMLLLSVVAALLPQTVVVAVQQQPVLLFQALPPLVALLQGLGPVPAPVPGPLCKGSALCSWPVWTSGEAPGVLELSPGEPLLWPRRVW